MFRRVLIGLARRPQRSTTVSRHSSREAPRLCEIWRKSLRISWHRRSTTGSRPRSHNSPEVAKRSSHFLPVGCAICTTSRADTQSGENTQRSCFMQIDRKMPTSPLLLCSSKAALTWKKMHCPSIRRLKHCVRVISPVEERKTASTSIKCGCHSACDVACASHSLSVMSSERAHTTKHV